MTTRTVVVLALDDVIPYDLAIPCEAFGRLRLPSGKAAYRVVVCGERSTIRAGSFSISLDRGLEAVAAADMILVPGIEDVGVRVSDDVLDVLKAAYARGVRIASICSGAFVLAAAGLLDGRRATTHWMAAERLSQAYPMIDVDPNVLFVDTGSVVTSAGASAGMDMCLHLVRRDHGQAMASLGSRLAVAPLVRSGGQAQYILHDLPRSGERIGAHLAWFAENLHQDLTVKAMATRAGMSERTFARRFVEVVGSTPLQWLLSIRVRRAQELLETIDAAVDQIAFSCGFRSATTFRACFRRVVGVGPSAYRNRFQVPATR